MFIYGYANARLKFERREAMNLDLDLNLDVLTIENL